MNTEESFLMQLFKPETEALFSVGDTLMCMAVSTVLCFILAYVYRITHRGTSYSQSFLITMFLMAISTGVVMMIIGSNIARAFSLVGALSIIRFRTAVKDPRDTGFLFVAMIAGMGCGTQFYMASIMLTVFVSILSLVLYTLDYGIHQQVDSILHVTVKETPENLKQVDAVFKKTFRDFTNINRIFDCNSDEVTNVYSVQKRSKTNFQEFENELKSIDGVVKFSRYETDQHAPV